jgi:hypothetical protein
MQKCDLKIEPAERPVNGKAFKFWRYGPNMNNFDAFNANRIETAQFSRWFRVM